MKYGSSKLISKHAFQPTLVFTTEKGNLCLCVWNKMEEGDSLAIEQEKKRQNNYWSVKVWKFSFPFPLGEKESFQGPEIVKCYFLFPFFEAQGNLKSHGYSSLVTILFQNWGLFRCCVPFRPPGILSSPTMSTGWGEIVESFFYNTPSRFFFFTSHILSRNHAEWLSSAAWRLICSHAGKSSIPSYFLLSSYF